MKKNNGIGSIKKYDLMYFLMMIILIIIPLVTIFTLDTGKSYDFLTLRGDKVRIFGSGIYKYDTLFRAGIFIGTDIVSLIVLPFSLYFYLRYRNKGDGKYLLITLSMVVTNLYYAISISFGVTYNYLMLLYIILLGISLFLTIFIIDDLRKNYTFTDKGYPVKASNIFLIVSSLILLIAWVPGIIASVIDGRLPSQLETYTTEITYGLDLGIIVPSMLIARHLTLKKAPMGFILLSILYISLALIGLTVTGQSIVQYFLGIEVPLIELLSKVISFILLSFISIYFIKKLYGKVEVLKNNQDNL